MDVSVNGEGEKLVRRLIAQGQYRSATEIMVDGLHLLQAREARLPGLRAAIQAADREGGAFSDTDADSYLHEVAGPAQPPTA